MLGRLPLWSFTSQLPHRPIARKVLAGLCAVVVVSLIELPSSVAAGPTVQLRTLDGRTKTGQVQSLTETQIQLVDQPPEPLRNVQSVGLKAASSVPRDAIAVSLSDGSILAAKTYSVSNGTANIETVGGAEVSLRVSGIQDVRFGQSSPAAAKQWKEIQERDLASDLLILQKDNSLDFIEGVVGDVTEKTVEFTLGDESIKARRSKVYGLMLFQQRVGRNLPDCKCSITEQDGTRWQAAKVRLTDEGLEIQTVGDLTTVRPLDRLAGLDFSLGKIAYLTDLEPLSTKLTPFFDIVAQPRTNTNLEGGPLKIGSRTFSNGLALHSRTELTYGLRGQYRRFVAIAGIDEVVGDLGHAELIISGDNRRLFSRELTGSDDPLPIELNVTGVQRLQILVDFGKDIDTADHVDLCEARVLK